MKVTKWLVVNGRGDMKVRSTVPRPRQLGYDELAFPLIVNIPDTWKKVYPEVEVDLPVPSQAQLEIGEAMPILAALAES